MKISRTTLAIAAGLAVAGLATIGTAATPARAATARDYARGDTLTCEAFAHWAYYSREGQLLAPRALRPVRHWSRYARPALRGDVATLTAHPLHSGPVLAVARDCKGIQPAR